MVAWLVLALGCKEPFVDVAITSPTGGATLLGTRTVTIEGTIEASADVESVSVAIGALDPVEATFDATSFSASVDLGDGDNVVTVAASTANADGSASIALRYPYVTLSSFPAASLVLGQADFVTADELEPGPVAVAYPIGNATWGDGVLYVPGGDYNRVLGFRGFPARNGEPADFAIGQTSLSGTTPGTSATTVSSPETTQVVDGVAWVLDYGNGRLLAYEPAPTGAGAAADFVVGQPDLDTESAACNHSYTNYPGGFVVIGERLFVSDSNNHRVLIWNAIPTTSGALPDLVLGQADFTHCQANDDDQDGVADATPSARTLHQPTGIATDGSRLFVADADNHRVLAWDPLPTSSFEPADYVLGQPDLVSAAQATSQDGMRFPLHLSSNGNQLAVADQDNHRVLLWNSVPTARTSPDVVIGQSDFDHGAENDDDQDGDPDAAPSARTLDGPVGVAFVRDALIVTDIDNLRMLLFGPLPCPEGMYEPPGASEGACVDDPCQPDPCTSGVCRNDSGSAVCD